VTHVYFFVMVSDLDFSLLFEEKQRTHHTNVLFIWFVTIVRIHDMHLFFVTICRVDFLWILENSQFTLNANALFICIYCNFCNCCNFFFQSVSIYRNTLCTFYFDFIVWPFFKGPLFCVLEMALFSFFEKAPIDVLLR